MVPAPSLFRDKNSEEKKVRISPETVEHLERLALVDFANVKGIERLEDAIDLANKIVDVDTTGVEPLYTLLENETLRLREDEAVDPNCKRKLLNLSALIEEDYYVAPQGNIPLSQTSQYDRNKT